MEKALPLTFAPLTFALKLMTIGLWAVEKPVAKMVGAYPRLNYQNETPPSEVDLRTFYLELEGDLNSQY